MRYLQREALESAGAAAAEAPPGCFFDALGRVLSHTQVAHGGAPETADAAPRTLLMNSGMCGLISSPVAESFSGGMTPHLRAPVTGAVSRHLRRSLPHERALSRNAGSHCGKPRHCLLGQG